MAETSSREASGREISHEGAIARSIFLSTDLLGRRLALAIAATRPLVKGDGITLKCPGEVTLYAEGSGKESETDWGPFDTRTAAQAQADAITAAEAEARQDVSEDLDEQIALVNCPKGCTKVVGAKNITITGPAAGPPAAGQITGTWHWGAGSDTYTAEATAEGDVKVQCTRP